MNLIQLIIIVFFCCVSKLEAGLSDEHDLIMAAASGNVESVIDYVKNKNVYVSTKNNYGVSPIIYAANNGHVDVCKVLIEFGAPIDDTSNNGKTPLHWASLWGHIKVAKYLIEHGADLNKQDIDGMTPLMTAVFKGHFQIARALVENGANLSIVNNMEADTMMIAKNRNDIPMINLLAPYFPPELFPSDHSPYYIVIQIILREISKLIKLFMMEVCHLFEEWNFIFPFLTTFNTTTSEL